MARSIEILTYIHESPTSAGSLSRESVIDNYREEAKEHPEIVHFRDIPGRKDIAGLQPVGEDSGPVVVYGESNPLLASRAADAIRRRRRQSFYTMQEAKATT